MKPLNCQQLITRINAIKFMTDDFVMAYNKLDIETSKKLMNEIKSTIKDLEPTIWPLEILTQENISRQYDAWIEIYKDLDSKYTLPTKTRLLEFLQKNRKFLELMRTKEKQGLDQMIISPAPGFHTLESIANNIESKIKQNG